MKIGSKRFYVVSCPSCGFIFLTTASKRAKCRKCGRTFKIVDNLLLSTASYDKARIKYYQAIGSAKWIRYQHID